MIMPETAKRHTMGAALRIFDQLAGQIDYQTIGLQAQTQGLPRPKPNYFDSARKLGMALAQFAEGSV
jgi:hypothetical protein